MIRGRPTQLWLALVGAIATAVGSTALVVGADPTIVATLSVAYVGVASAALGLLANQPPTMIEGDTYTIQTPKGYPNYVATVQPPPAPTQPVPVADNQPQE